jgi:hypothetical protein
VDAKALIDSYSDEVARLLPRRIRNDVGWELRALLTDQLNTAVKNAGRAADEDMTLRILRSFGRPDQVAARYQPRGFNIIEPEHAGAFLKLAVACIAVQWLITLPSVFSSKSTVGEWWLRWGAGALWWVGLLVLWFGIAGWIQRRSPVDPHSFQRPWTHFIFWVPVRGDWQPNDPLFAGAKVAIPLATLFIVFFSAPAAILQLAIPAGTDTSWAHYSADFERLLLPPLIALMVVRLALFTASAVSMRWRASTEPVRFCLWVGFVGLLAWAAIGWDLFESPGTDILFKVWLWIFVLINALGIIAWIRRTLGRVRVPKMLAKSARDDLG